jgi:hypothetical protein
MINTRRPVDAWLLPNSLCGDRVAHPPHDWSSVRWEDEDQRFWCRGRMPFTVESAAQGMQWVETLRQAEGWREMCERTAAGRQFLMSADWRRLYRELQARDEQAKAEKRATPILVRLVRRIL